MSIIWRYLLRNFLQTFILCVSAFVAVLLVSRFQTIARFASTGAPITLLFKFAAAQIPYILPVAIPVSCLISSYLLFQRLSQTYELTAFRTAGLGLTTLCYPIGLAGAIIALLNFSIVSEISPICRNFSKNLLCQMTFINPLCLLQKGAIFQNKNTFIDLKFFKSGQYAQDVCVISYNTKSQRLGFMLAKKLFIEKNQLIGNDVTFVSSTDPKNPNIYDHLIIENQSEIRTSSDQLPHYFINHLIKSNSNFKYDHLSCRMLQAKRLLDKTHVKRFRLKAEREMIRRFSLAVASLFFSIVGIASGIEVGRSHRFQGLAWAISLMSLYLVTYVTAKSLNFYPKASIIIYALPYPFLFAYCIMAFRKFSKGIGS